MITYFEKRHNSLSYRILSAFIAFTFIFSLVLPPGYAQLIPQTLLNLPAPGMMVTPTSGFTPAMVTGITIHPENPLRFDFIMDRGQSGLAGEPLKEEYTKMIKYFMASLTVPEDELWVNLSPYEKDRMVPQGLGDTEMGRDMLAQDYLLKQLTASLMYPEKELGKEFWNKVYKEAHEKFGTTEIPVNTFNKVWIVPAEALVYEQGSSAFVIKSRLGVMLEQDYKAMSHKDTRSQGHNDTGDVVTATEGSPRQGSDPVTTGIIREVIIPAIEQEINEGKNFASLRQIYNALILATWYKQRLKDSLLGKVYVDQNKTRGIDTQDKGINQKIYDQYIESFKKGVYNFIKEDVDPATDEIVPRKYFSGGMAWKLGGLKTVGALALGTLLSFGSPDFGNASALAAAAMGGNKDGVTTEFVDNADQEDIGTAIVVKEGAVQPVLLTGMWGKWVEERRLRQEEQRKFYEEMGGDWGLWQQEQYRKTYERLMVLSTAELINVIRQEGYPTLGVGADILAERKDRSTVKPLVELYRKYLPTEAWQKEGPFYARADLVSAIGRIGGNEAKRFLQETVKNDPSPTVRDVAKQKLSTLKEGAVQPQAEDEWGQRQEKQYQKIYERLVVLLTAEIINVISREGYPTLGVGANILAERKDLAAVKPLIELYREYLPTETWQKEGPFYARADLVSAIGRIGGDEAKRFLQETVKNDPSSTVRDVAKQQLLRLSSEPASSPVTLKDVKRSLDQLVDKGRSGPLASAQSFEAEMTDIRGRKFSISDANRREIIALLREVEEMDGKKVSPLVRELAGDLQDEVYKKMGEDKKIRQRIQEWKAAQKKRIDVINVKLPKIAGEVEELLPQIQKKVDRENYNDFLSRVEIDPLEPLDDLARVSPKLFGKLLMEYKSVESERMNLEIAADEIFEEFPEKIQQELYYSREDGFIFPYSSRPTGKPDPYEYPPAGEWGRPFDEDGASSPVSKEEGARRINNLFDVLREMVEFRIPEDWVGLFEGKGVDYRWYAEGIEIYGDEFFESGENIVLWLGDSRAVVMTKDNLQNMTRDLIERDPDTAENFLEEMEAAVAHFQLVEQQEELMQKIEGTRGVIAGIVEGIREKKSRISKLSPEERAELQNENEAWKKALKEMSGLAADLRDIEKDLAELRKKSGTASSLVEARDLYRDFYDSFGAKNKTDGAITGKDVGAFSQAFLSPDAQLLPYESRRNNGTLGVTEVNFLEDSATRQRMTAFQQQLKAAFGDKVYLVAPDKLHFTIQGLETQWADKAAGTKKELAMHAGLETIDMERGVIREVRERARNIVTPSFKMQVAGLNWNPQTGIFWELRPYLAGSQEDPVMQRRKTWELPQPRPPHVTAAYFTQEFNPEDMTKLRQLVAQYQNSDYFGDIAVNNVEVIAYTDFSFNAGYKVLENVPLTASSPVVATKQDVRTWSGFEDLKPDEIIKITAKPSGKDLKKRVSVAEVGYVKQTVTPSRLQRLRQKLTKDIYTVELKDRTGKNNLLFNIGSDTDGLSWISVFQSENYEFVGTTDDEKSQAINVAEAMKTLTFRVFEGEKRIEVVVSEEWFDLLTAIKGRKLITDAELETLNGYRFEFKLASSPVGVSEDADDIIERMVDYSQTPGSLASELIRWEPDYSRGVEKFSTEQEIISDNRVPWSSPTAVQRPEEVGGINLDPALLDLQIRRDGNGVPLPLPMQPIQDMHIDGFLPIIINVTPITNLPMLLGLADTEQDADEITPAMKAREPEEISALN